MAGVMRCWLVVAGLSSVLAKPMSSPDKRCRQVGQFVRDDSSRCSYLVCDYVQEPWIHPYNARPFLVAVRQHCPYGTALPQRFDGGYSNPCTITSYECNPPPPPLVHEAETKYKHHKGLEPKYEASKKVESKYETFKTVETKYQDPDKKTEAIYEPVKQHDEVNYISLPQPEPKDPHPKYQSPEETYYEASVAPKYEPGKQPEPNYQPAEHSETHYEPVKQFDPEHKPVKKSGPKYEPAEHSKPHYEPVKQFDPEYEPVEIFGPKYNPTKQTVPKFEPEKQTEPKHEPNSQTEHYELRKRPELDLEYSKQTGPTYEPEKQPELKHELDETLEPMYESTEIKYEPAAKDGPEAQRDPKYEPIKHIETAHQLPKPLQAKKIPNKQTGSTYETFEQPEPKYEPSKQSKTEYEAPKETTAASYIQPRYEEDNAREFRPLFPPFPGYPGFRSYFHGPFYHDNDPYADM